MSGEDFFAHTTLDLEAERTEDADARLAALLQLYLRGAFEAPAGCWNGRDEHDTLRRTCHAAEVLHRLNLDSHTAAMVQSAGNWLINLPIGDHLLPSERTRARLYPSRFKTLAYLRRFEDEVVRRDFLDLLKKEVAGMIRGVTESDVLTTCIVLDTLLTLERTGDRRDVCSDERLHAIVGALRQQFRQWRPPDAPVATRRVRADPAEESRVPTRKRAGALSEIDTPRDLSYVLGLLLHVDRTALAPRQVALVTSYLTRCIAQRDRARGSDLVSVLYAALQLAEHGRGDESVVASVQDLLAELRGLYAMGEVPRRWDLGTHTLVLRLLLTHYGEATLARGIAAYYLQQAEQRRSIAHNTLETELKQVIRERVEIEFGAITELGGGFSADHVYRVPFTYWYPVPGSGRRMVGAGPHETSVIIKRSTGDAFYTATENYRQLPPALRRLFVRQPSESQVYKSETTSAYYLTMEDLADLSTLMDLINQWDQRAMHEHHARLLPRAAERVCDASFQLFRETLDGRSGAPGTQIARLYLAPIESKLARAVQRVPWLKNPLQGFVVSDQRYRGLDYYLTMVSKYASQLQPRFLGLVHGDLHAGNVMLDESCTRLKLIDLDKLSWTGDYLADLGNLLTDVSIYRRVAEPQRSFGLPRDEITFISHSAEVGTAENAVRYPALGRPATLALQRHALAAIEQFAAEIGDRTWKPRLWLAAATALCARLSFQSHKEPAAVLYGEAIRLLHELTRFLEHGQSLPEVLVPQTRPAITGQPPAAETPLWVEQHAMLLSLHEGLRRMGLLPRVERDAISYHDAATGEAPVIKLVQPRREGIARMLLPAAPDVPVSADDVKIVRSRQPGDALGTIVIITEETSASAALRVARLCVQATVGARVTERP
jgi:hypothetical protein